MKTKKNQQSETTIETYNGNQLAQDLSKLSLEECEVFFQQNKHGKCKNILKNHTELMKAFLRLDDERAEILLNNLEGLNLTAYKETAAIRGTFQIIKNNNFGNVHDFIAILRVIFHCDKEKISSILENLHISFYERMNDVNHQTSDANKLLEKQIALDV